MITASAWKPRLRGASMQGFIDLTLHPSELVLKECILHERDGKRWVAMPAKPQFDAEGKHRLDPAGKRLYCNLIDFADKASRERFQAAALAAIDRMLRKGAAP